MKSISIFAVIAVLVCAASAVAADSAEETLRSVGLFGHWARQCDAPASVTNNHIRFAKMPTGEVQEIFDFGPGSDPNVYTITSAARVAAVPGEVRLGVSLRGVSGELILLVHDNTIRTISSIDSDGTVRVKDGVILANGSETHVLPRCD